jgi:hypothetical protein
MAPRRAANLLRNQAGHAWQTEIKIIVLLIGVGLALFIPKIHSGLWNAVGSTAIGVFLFFLGLVVLILVFGFLVYLKDRFLDWVQGPPPAKKPPQKPSPEPPATKEPPPIDRPEP